MLDGIQFEYLSAKLAWSSVGAASADAQQCIDLMESRLNVQF
jgi:myosin heavy subunit